jgi:hypothetical protein
MTLWSRVYSGLASLKLTIVTLAVLAVVLIYGTFYESANGTPMAQHAVYASKWFDCILLTLFVNMVACTTKRYPYKPHQLGFLMVHCGILTILTGAMLTRNFGRDGELFVNEGDTRNAMTSTRTYLRVAVPQDGVQAWDVPVVFPAKASGANVDRELRLPHGPVRLHFTRYFPNARWVDTVAEGEHPNPAVRIRWAVHEAPGEAWLLPREAGRERVDQPVRVDAVEARDTRNADSLLAALAAPAPAGRGELRLQSGAQRLADIPLDGDLPRRVKAGPYEVTLRQWYSNFRIQDGQPVNASAAMANPALVFEIAGPRGTENHVVFAFHEMGSLMGPDKGLGYDIDADYIYRDDGGTAPRVLLVRTPDGGWRIASNFDLQVPADGRVAMGTLYHAHSNGYEITVQEALDRAVSQSEMVNVDRQEQNPAVQFRLENGGTQTEPRWLAFGDTATVRAGDRDVKLELLRRRCRSDSRCVSSISSKRRIPVRTAPRHSRATCSSTTAAASRCRSISR